MKADREDAPWSARQRRKDSSGVLLISLTAGCLAIGGALLYHHERLPQSSPPLPVPASTPATRTIVLPALSPISAPVTQRPQSPAAATSNASRQSEFNDRNYRPRSDINVIQSVQPRLESRQVAQVSKPASRISKKARWRWEFAGKTTHGEFIWYEAGGRIDWSSVCSNYPDGSLTYRDCRKAAKAVFASLCQRNSRSPACAAARFYNPLSG